MKWIKRLWVRLFKRHKGYIETVLEDRPIEFYLMSSKEDFIPRDE